MTPWFKATDPLIEGIYWWRREASEAGLTVCAVVGRKIYRIGNGAYRTDFTQGEWSGPLEAPE